MRLVTRASSLTAHNSPKGARSGDVGGDGSYPGLLHGCVIPYIRARVSLCCLLSLPSHKQSLESDEWETRSSSRCRFPLRGVYLKPSQLPGKDMMFKPNLGGLVFRWGSLVQRGMKCSEAARAQPQEHRRAGSRPKLSRLGGQSITRAPKFTPQLANVLYVTYIVPPRGAQSYGLRIHFLQPALDHFI